MIRREVAFISSSGGGCAPFTFTQKSGHEGKSERKVLAVLARIVRYPKAGGTSQLRLELV